MCPIVNGVLVNNGRSGDGKRLFLNADTNDGWKDLRIEVDTDDCDSAHAKEWASRLIALTVAMKGIDDPIAYMKAMQKGR